MYSLIIVSTPSDADYAASSLSVSPTTTTAPMTVPVMKTPKPGKILYTLI